MSQLFLHSQAIWYQQESRRSRSGVMWGWRTGYLSGNVDPTYVLGCVQVHIQLFTLPCCVAFGSLKMEITIVPSQNCSEDEWVRPQALCRPSRCNLALFLLPMCLPQPAHGVSLSPSLATACAVCADVLPAFCYTQGKWNWRTLHWIHFRL